MVIPQGMEKEIMQPGSCQHDTPCMSVHILASNVSRQSKLLMTVKQSLAKSLPK